MPNIALIFPCIRQMPFNETIPMLPNTAPIKPKKRSAVISALLVALCSPAQADVQSLLAADPVIQKLKIFNNPTANSFSRADATLLLDRLLIITVPGFDKNMDDYLNPFGDVNSSSDVYTALMQLAYYRGRDTETVVTRENNLFRPLDYVTRQEFLKMALQGFNIAIKNTNNLAGFNDDQNIAAWAVKYFSTAVAQGIMVGDTDGNLNPDKNLTTYEALLILDRIVAKYGAAYLHNGNGFDAPEAVNLDKVLTNTIGVEHEPDTYEANATPIDIADIAVENPANNRCGGGAKVLRAVSTVDQTTGAAAPYYQWTVSNGYLGKYQDAGGETTGASLQTVCFYPPTLTVPDYRVTVTGGDNLGFVDSYSKTLPAATFATINTIHNSTAINLAIVQPPASLTAGQIAVLDLTGSYLKEGGVNVALEQISVTLTIGRQTLNLYSGNPDGDKINFAVPTLENLYGKTGTLAVTAHTQSAKKIKAFQNVRYLPQFAVKGEVLNNGLGAVATAVRVGTTTVNLDESNGFYVPLPGDLNAQTVNIDVLGGDPHNQFTAYPVTLTYPSPTAYVVMVGEDALADSDSDGMTDEWEKRFGLNPYDAADAALDLDKDGFTNLAEFNGGSDPTDAASKPWAIKATAGDKQVTLQWAAVAGASNYGVCYATETIADINNCLNYAGGIWQDITATSLKISNLINGTKYYVRVLAENASGTLRVSAAVTVTPKPLSTLNDTGITTCSDAYENGLPCPVAGYPGQDAESGRDVTQNNDSDGHAGFNFTKLSATGAALAASATSWNCAKDNVTGLIWEVKTDDGGLHDKDWDYTWYESDNTKNGDWEGVQNGGFCGGTSACDTAAYVTAVNAAGWCGYKDWRLPSKSELHSIIDYSRYSPVIDTSYFPNTKDSWYWTSSPVASSSGGAWIVDFGDGWGFWNSKDYYIYVRLVRSGQ